VENGDATVVISILLPFVALVALLVALLVWSLRRPARHAEPPDLASSLEQVGRRHSTYLPLIRQTLSPPDFEFLAARGSAKLVRRTRKDRRRIALSYLTDLRADFYRLLRLAQVIAVLSPEVGAAQELERIRLSIRFSWRYQMVRVGLCAGLPLLPQLSGIGDMVSALGVRMETALKELGERAAFAAELASSLDRRSLDTA
jgi:hypothetical protein